MRPLLFFIAFIGILISSNIYLTRRFAFFFNTSSSWHLYVTFAAITIYMIGGLIVFTNAEGNFANLAYSAAAILMGLMLFLLLAVILVDLTGLIVKFNPRTFGIAAIVIALMVSAYGIWNATNKRIRQVEIPIEGLTTEINAALLTDIHIGHFWGIKTLENVVDKTNALNPDVVFITGDLFDGKIRLNNASLSPLKRLNAPVYFVEGNHDGYSGAKEIKQKLRDIGVEVLENEVSHFNQLQIIGLDHMRPDDETVSGHTSDTGPTMEETLKELNIFPNKPTVLLHHSPDGIEYANQHGVDLFLAGHTHAGQIFPVVLIANKLFAYNKGLHDYKGTKMYVSQGVGTFGPPMRVGTISEITQLKLIPQ